VTTQRLVHMANQGASFFTSYPEAEAVDGIANHLKSFWGPRVRLEIEAHTRDKAGAGLSNIAMEAVKRIVAKDAEKKSA
jgi:formate dehydrogenase subunit delta